MQEKYGSDLLRIYRKENGNWGSVHNFAKKLPINGKFVKTLDSDDYLDPHSLIKFISFLKNLPDDIDIVFSNVNFIDKNDNLIYQKFYNKLFKRQIFKIEDLKITKLSVLTIHTFTCRAFLYRALPDLPTKMSYMDSVMIFLLLSLSFDRCAFFSGPALYQYRSGGTHQTISVQNFSKHTDWLEVMVETQAKYTKENELFLHNSDGKNKVLGQMMELSFFLYVFAMSYKKGISNREKSKSIYHELLKIEKILGRDYFKRYFASYTTRFLRKTRFKLFPPLVHLLATTLNTGYLKATKKDGERKNLSLRYMHNQTEEN